jgi:hypothetical protein
LSSIHEHVYRRRVNSSSTIQVDRHSYYVGEAWAGHPVLVQVDAPQEAFHIRCNEQNVTTVAMKGLVNAELDFAHYLDLMKREARTLRRTVLNA